MRSLFFFLTIPPPPRSTLFPYTTLFRSPPSRTRSTTPTTRCAPCPCRPRRAPRCRRRSEEHTSELQSHSDLVCRLLLEKKKQFEYIESSLLELDASADYDRRLTESVESA